MFTGIIETMGRVKDLKIAGTNTSFIIESDISDELKIDQSISHNGICLTVEQIQHGTHQVTAISETIEKTEIGSWKPGTLLNLERCLAANGRLDGHFVQGHVDCTATCIRRKDKNGSWEFEFEFPGRFGGLIIEKGSIAINGISLTVFNVKRKKFSVAIIPYTFQHTNMKHVQEGSTVNIEFDLLGKYITRSMKLSNGIKK